MPLYRTPQRFPGLQRLPQAAGDLISALFPPDQLTTPGAIVGPRVPVPKPQGKNLADAFRPWGKNLEKAMPQLYGPSQVPGAPETAGKVSNAFDTYRQILMDLLQRR